MNRLQQIEARMNDISALVSKSENVEEIKTLSDEYNTLKEERSVLVSRENIVGVTPTVVSEVRNGLPIPTVSGNGQENYLASAEYRSAFRNYVSTGEDNPIVAKVRGEQRAAGTTKTTDITAVIPTTIMDRVIETLADYGDIWPRVTKLNVPGGIEFPIAGTKPTATWTAEGSVAGKQKKTVTGKVSFTYHKLQIRMATTLEASIVSLDVFEKLISENIAEAIVVALEDAIFNGTGTGQPLGILQDTRIVAAQKHDFLATDATWDGWKKKFFAKIPAAYRKKKKGIIFVDYATWDAYIDGMVDDNGQPVARTNYGINGEETLRFNGYTVVPVPYLPDFDTAEAGDVFLVYIDFAEYVVNSNMGITYRKYFDEGTDEWIEKITMIADGKMLDVNGVVMLKKATI